MLTMMTISTSIITIKNIAATQNKALIEQG